MQQRAQISKKVSPLISLQKQSPQVNKQTLWRQLPSATKSTPNELNDLPSKNQKSQQLYKIDCNLLSPVAVKKKQKRPTISNFLKCMQVQIDHDENQSKLDGDSEVLSILDIKYGDSFHTQKHLSINNSILADNKFHIYLLISAYKQTYTSIKDTLVTFFNSYQQQQKIMTQNIKKLLNKYETELNTKTIQQKNIQLQLRQQRLNNIQQKYRIQTQIRQLQQKLKYTQYKLQQIQNKYKQQQQQYKQLKLYNKELNQIIMKSHKKVEDLQQKCKQIKQINQNIIQNQIKKIQDKYKNLMKQQSQGYQLKIQNIKIKLMNYMDTYNNSNSNNNINDSFNFKDGLIMNKNQEKDVSMDSGSNILSNLEEGPWNKRTQNKKNREGHNYLKKKQQAQGQNKVQNNRMLESISSPKSTTSGKRFARTSKPHNIDNSQNHIQKTAHQNTESNPNILSPSQKQEKKQLGTQRTQFTQNIKDNSHKNGYPLPKQRYSKLQNQASQSSLPSTNLLKKKNEEIITRQYQQIKPISMDSNISLCQQFSHVLDDENINCPISSRTNKTQQINPSTITQSIQSTQSSNLNNNSIKMNKYGSRFLNANQQTNNINKLHNTPNKNINQQASSTHVINRNIVQIDKKLRQTIL